MQQRGKKKRDLKSALLQRIPAAAAEVPPFFTFSLRRNKTKLFHTGFYSGSLCIMKREDG